MVNGGLKICGHDKTAKKLMKNIKGYCIIYHSSALLWVRRSSALFIRDHGLTRLPVPEWDGKCAPIRWEGAAADGTSFGERKVVMAETSLHAFKGTIAQERQLKEVIEKHLHQPGGLMPVLQEAQGIYGYLPEEVQTMIAEGLGISLSEVYGVATFYSQFSLTPKGENRVSICLGTACYVKGADKILAAVEEKLGIKSGECTPDGLFSIDSCRCVGACGLAPVMMVNDDVYGKMTPEQVGPILDRYTGKKGGGQS